MIFSDNNEQMTNEEKTIEVMLGLYCKAHHGPTLCPECLELLRYARAKLQACPIKASKPPCSKCKIHCYESSHRERIRKLMREIGPRLLFIHPQLALRHFVLSLKHFAREMKDSFLALPFAFKDKRTPWAPKILAFVTFAYGCSPIDLIPDFIPVLGYLDDLILLPLGVYFTIKLIPQNIWEDCLLKQTQFFKKSKPTNYLAAVVILILWAFFAYLLIRQFY